MWVGIILESFWSRSVIFTIHWTDFKLGNLKTHWSGPAISVELTSSSSRQINANCTILDSCLMLSYRWRRWSGSCWLIFCSSNYLSNSGFIFFFCFFKFEMEQVIQIFFFDDNIFKLRNPINVDPNMGFQESVHIQLIELVYWFV